MPKANLKRKLERLQHSLHRPKINNTLNTEPKKPSRTIPSRTIHLTEIDSKVERSYLPFSNSSKILLVGEGNFSFATVLSNYCTDITATSYDSRDDLFLKYEDAKGHIEQLEHRGVKVMHSVDACKLSKLFKERFTRIVFLFPHVGMGIKDRERNILANQTLLDGFFKESSKLLDENGKVDYKTSTCPKDYDFEFGFTFPDGMIERAQIMVALKSGDPYNDWNIRGIAKSNGLKYKECFPFDFVTFKGYEHRRTLGFDSKLSKGGNEELLNKKCKMYIFENEDFEDVKTEGKS
jgi:25S rRNA (uracil2634-N3)-methyltransferase